MSRSAESRGYFGIGIVAGKTQENTGGLWRSAHAFGASFIFTAGHRYPRQPSDTTKASRHVPLFTYPGAESLLEQRPAGCQLIGVECAKDVSGVVCFLPDFDHPERAIYVLGAEDRGLPVAVQHECDHLLSIPSALCLNVATTGALVLYDRAAKLPARVLEAVA